MIDQYVSSPSGFRGKSYSLAVSLLNREVLHLLPILMLRFAFFFCKRKHRVDYITFVSHTLCSSLKRWDNFSLAVSWLGEAIPPLLPTRSAEMHPSCVRCRHRPGCLQGSWELGQVLQHQGSLLTPGPAFSAASCQKHSR